MDVVSFREWMVAAEPGRRAEEAFALGRAYLHAAEGGESRESIEAAITLLLDDPSPTVRRALADALMGSADAPRHVILALAADRQDIAVPVLARSPVFLDGELVDLVATTIEPLQMAIAGRPFLSTAVSAAITELGSLETCRRLVANEGAEMARISLRRLVERFGDDPTIRDRLLAQPDLPGEVRQSLIRSLSRALGDLVSERAWLGRERADTVTRDACDRATVAIAAETALEELVPLAEHLRVTGQLTTSLLLRTVCAGNLGFLAAALSVLARLPERRVRDLIFEGRASAFAAVYRRAGLPPLAGPAFMAAVRTCRDWEEALDDPATRLRFTRRMVDEVLTRYQEITAGEMNELTSMLRRFAAEAARAAAQEFVGAAA